MVIEKVRVEDFIEAAKKAAEAMKEQEPSPCLKHLCLEEYRDMYVVRYVGDPGGEKGLWIYKDEAKEVVAELEELISRLKRKATIKEKIEKHKGILGKASIKEIMELKEEANEEDIQIAVELGKEITRRAWRKILMQA
ncbi:MAG: hypothetical protein F7C82_05820 [Desulfurococcales archaeon]|nr:hypothetical protein [Desulfurococcales archaeon]